MASVLKNAVKGNRGALTRLYEQTKKDCYFVAAQLVDSDKAEVAVANAYRDTMALSTLSTLADEAAFQTLVLETVVHYAKQQITRQNPKAFRLPADRRFDIRTAPTALDTDKATVFSAFTDLQRLLFVIHNATDFSEKQLTAITKLDARTLADARNAEHANIDTILGGDAFDGFVKEFKNEQASIKIPEALDSAVEAIIGDVVAPAEKARKKRTLMGVLITLGVCILLAGFSGLLIWDMTRPDTPTSDSDVETSNPAQESVGTVTSVNATHYADIDIKDHGTITVALDSTTAPETVTNFLMLADSGFYNGLTFHRIMNGFMMQGGDPLGNGTGGSDTNITGEFASNGFENPLSHVRGAISMARASDYNSASSQFFIVHEDSTFLDGEYAVFGYVTEGMDIVDAICTSAQPTDDNGTIPADQQPIINSITVRSAV